MADTSSFDVPGIAGGNLQENEYYLRRIVEIFPERATDPRLVYGDARLEFFRLANSGAIPVAPTDGSLAYYIGDTNSQTSLAVNTAMETLLGTKKFAKQGDIFINVKDHGARGLGTNYNDTAAIQSCIDMAAAAGGGTVFVPAGTYPVTQLRLKSKVILMGAGWGTRILHRTASTGHLIVLDTVSVEQTVLRDVLLHGNKDNQTQELDGVNYDNTAGSFSFYDPNHIIENVLVYIPKGNGFTISANSRETKMVNCFVTGADRSGYNLSATDSVLVNCTTGAAGGAGFVIRGPNSRFVNCKSFGSGRLNIAGFGSGFRIYAKRVSMTGCEAQDNAHHGFLISDIKGAVIALTGCVADNNGRAEGNNYEGFYLRNVSHVAISGGLSFNREPLLSQRYGLSLAGDCEALDISLIAVDNRVKDYIAVGNFTNNYVRINGTEITLPVPDPAAA